MIKRLGFRVVRAVGNLIRRLYWRSVYEGYRECYAIDATFRFNGEGIYLYGTGDIALGADSYIGDGSSIQAFPGCRVSIGAKCQISHNVRLYTQSAIADADFSQTPIPSKSADIVIGNFCWIGANVFIGPGVQIGDNAVVGANSVVTRSVGAGEIWGGVPAKCIRTKFVR